jgi:hypothetical protein
MDRRDAVAAGLLVAGLTAWLLPMANYGVDPHHDGIMLKPALDVLAGQTLFRDTFTQYGALTTYLQTMALWCHPALSSLRVLTLAAHGITLLYLYAAWRLILPRSLTVLSCGVFILFIPCYERDWLGAYWMLMPWSSVFALMFQSVALYALFRMILGGQPVRWAALLGAACACVFWSRAPVGILMTGGLAVIWLALGWTGWTPPGASQGAVLAGLLGGFALVHGFMLGAVLLAGAGPEWWYQNIVWPRKWVQQEVVLTWRQFLTVFVHPGAAAWLLALPLLVLGLRQAKRLRPGLPAWLPAAGYAGLGSLMIWQHDRVLAALALRTGGWTALVPLVVLSQALVSLWQAFRPRDRPAAPEYHLVAAGTVLAVGALGQYYPLPDPWHILWSMGPALGLWAFVLWRWLDWPAPVVALALAAAFLPAAYAKARSTVQAQHEPWVTLEAPAVLRGMKVLPDQARLYPPIADTVARVLQHRPDLPAAVIGYDALYLCFVPNLANPLPYFVNWANLIDAASEQKRWQYIHDVRPLIFFERANWSAVGEFYQRENYVPLLYVAEIALEIAVPREIANELGVAAYGQTLPPGNHQPMPK